MSLLLSNALVVVLCSSSFGASFQGEKEAKETAGVKAQIEKLGARTTQVEIRLRDKKKLKGYVQQIAADHFVISDLNTAAETNVAYAEVQQVRQIKDHHLSDCKLSTIAIVMVTALYVWANWTDKP
jgi:hypothetical protein